MTTVVTYIEVRSANTSQAVALINDYFRGTRGEAGLSAIDALQEVHRRNRFMVVETWADETALHMHESADHTLKFVSGLKEVYGAPNDRRVHTSFAVSQRSQMPASTALYVVTHVDVPPPRREETEVLLKRMAEDTPKDRGNQRYDVFQQLAPRTNHFTVVESWADENAFSAHQAQAHTLQFREALGPMLGAPYEDRLYQRPG